MRVALVARGAGTGTTGAAVPLPDSIAVVHPHGPHRGDRAGDRRAVVQPVFNGALQQALAPHGLFWAPDPSSGDLQRGQPGLHAGGPRAVKYGTSRDNVWVWWR